MVQTCLESVTDGGILVEISRTNRLQQIAPLLDPTTRQRRQSSGRGAHELLGDDVNGFVSDDDKMFRLQMCLHDGLESPIETRRKDEVRIAWTASVDLPGYRLYDLLLFSDQFECVHRQSRLIRLIKVSVKDTMEK